MEQLAVMKKAELSGTKPYAMAVIMFGCKKMFLDAASAFNNCGSSGFNLAQRCNVGIRGKVHCRFWLRSARFGVICAWSRTMRRTSK
jgi:singapore isolate B (sub-type 7) whole genome shotgun sequence assembly, scaffold_5